VNPTWTAKFESLPVHPVTRGVKPFTIHDEWYYHMRFAPDRKGVTPILSVVPPLSTLDRGNGPHNGNPFVRASVAKGEPQPLMWTYDRPNGGRGFGFTGGHYHKNWGDENFRKVFLNALLWIAKVEVPKEGVVSTVTPEELRANQDPK
jgi:type 1 glutamine amidotransferase